MPRKAKVSVETEKNDVQKSSKPIMLGVLLTFGVVATTGVIMWARSDIGQIDVSATIANSGNATGQNGEVVVPPPSEAFQNMPNGGLVPQQPDTTTPPPQESEQASTTDATATTSESTIVEQQQEGGVTDVVPEGESGEVSENVTSESVGEVQ